MLYYFYTQQIVRAFAVYRELNNSWIQNSLNEG